MRSKRPCPGYLRWTIACGGAIGFLLAVDAIAIVLFMVLDPIVTGSTANPYAGAAALIAVPVVLVGFGAAWCALRFWRVTALAEEQPAVTAASR